MSESDTNATEDEAAAGPLNASLRVDPRSLATEEQDFARQMGFGEEANESVAASATEKPAAKTPTTVADALAVPLAPQAETPPATLPTAIPEAPPTRPRDWEEIHPRAATLGRQSALIERADRVMKLESTATAIPATAPESSLAVAVLPGIELAGLCERLKSREAQIAELEKTAHDLSDALEAKEHELAQRAERPSSATQFLPEHEKVIAALQHEVDTLLEERDRQGDALAAASTTRVEAQNRIERLETALRVTRGPTGPVPDGERDLRAEVIGLRRRLDESGAENRRLRETLDSQATELAIAGAHRDDRQQEIDQYRGSIASFERERAQQIERLDEALVRQRELLALVSRVQAENVDLRSTQAALEETLEARDLEISARDEHLQITRRGLVARDEQLIDASERLEQARHRHELLETELERARLAQSELDERLIRREARIASLSTTLIRIEEAIGRPAPRALVEASEAAPAPRPAPKPAPSLSLPTSQPEAFTVWRNDKLSALSGEGTTVFQFLARRLLERAGDTMPTCLRITSLGGSLPEAEVELARALMDRGVREVSIRVFERSSATCDARRQAVEGAGLNSSIAVQDWNDAMQSDEEPSDALLLSDALWGQTQPESILDRLVQRLSPNGLVLFADRIAGGPMELSETTLEKLAELWQVLPETWTQQAAFAAAPSAGDNGGAASPAESLVAALHARFAPLIAVGFGHVADVAFGPARGFALSGSGAAAEAFLASIDAIDESRSILESLPPRHGVALFGRHKGADHGEAAPVEMLGLEWLGSSS